MKNVISKIGLFAWFGLLLPTFTYSQNLSIKGEVRDAKTNQSLPFVNVFVSNSTKGTQTDTTGKFRINGLAAGTYSVVASMVGYESQTKEISLQPGASIPTLTFVLKEQEKGLDEVTIRAKRDKQWERNFKIFSEIFLGNDEYAKTCTITNPYVVDIEMADGGLVAKASSPIIIENRSLGYKLTFVLKQFEVSNNSYTIGGDTFFEELLASSHERARWQKNRLDAYRGSLGHLLQAFYRQSVEKEGFVLYTLPYERGTVQSANFSYRLNVENSIAKVSSATVAKSINDLMVLDASRIIEVHYLPKSETKLQLYSDVTHQVSRIDSKLKSLAFNQDGQFLDKYAAHTEGSFNNYRIASMLPTDYHPAVEDLLSSTKQSGEMFNQFQEKIFLHTNKPNYKPGETIWFKSYQVYQNQILKDAMSRTVYVDLVGKSRNILLSKIIQSKRGVAWGEFVLPDTLQSGTYFLRAYTNWMRNFGDTLQAVVEVPVIARTEVVLEQKTAYEEGGFQLNIDRQTVAADSAISFSIRGLPQHSYSVSITNEAQVGMYPPHKPVGFSQAYLDVDKVSYLAERGLRYVGKVRDASGRVVSGNIVVTRADTLMYEQLETNKVGEFEIPEIQAADTLVLSVIATNSKGKVIPNIELSLPKPLPFRYSPTPSLPPVAKNITTRPDFIDDNLRTIELLEVDIKGRKRRDTTQIQRYHMIFGKPSYEFTNKDLNFEGKTHFMQALQSKVPGLDVLYDYSTGKIYLRSLRHGSMQPVIWLDGMPYNDINDLSFLTGAMIARIDVYRLNSANFAQPGKTGLIAIYTKSFVGGDEQQIIDTPPAEGVRRFVLRGYARPKAFAVPTLKTEPSKRKALAKRTTIYWNPNLQTNESGIATVQMDAIAMPGRYRVQVVGYDILGNITRSESYLDIK